MVICDEDAGHAKNVSAQQLGAAGVYDEYICLYKEGVASKKLLKYLWKGEPFDFILDFMHHNMLSCNLTDELVLIPSLVPDNDDGLREIKGATCFLDFSEFFLPDDVFQRLVCLCAEHARQIDKRSLSPIVRKKAALLSFGFNAFRLDVEGDVIKIAVEEDVEDVPKIIKLLVSMFQKLKDDVMSERLKWKLVLQSPASGAKLEYSGAKKAREKGEAAVLDLNHKKVQLSEFDVFFDAKVGSLVDDGDNGTAEQAAEAVPLPKGCKYHVFLSHRQATAGDAVHVLC